MLTKDERTQIAALRVAHDHEATRVNNLANLIERHRSDLQQSIDALEKFARGVERRLRDRIDELVERPPVPPRVPDTEAHKNYRARVAKDAVPPPRPVTLPIKTVDESGPWMCHSSRLLPSGARALFREECDELVMVGVIQAGVPMNGFTVDLAMREWLAPTEVSAVKPQWADEEIAAFERAEALPINRIERDEPIQSEINRRLSVALGTMAEAQRDERIVSGHEEPVDPACGPWPNEPFDRVDEGVRAAVQAIQPGVGMVRISPNIERLSAQQMMREEHSVAVVARARELWRWLKMDEDDRVPRWFWEGYRAEMARNEKSERVKIP